MTHEEEYLNKRMGKRNPFTVPEGYFEQLTAQVMERIPEKKQPAKVAAIRQLRPWLYAAACLCVAVFTATMLLTRKGGEMATQPQQMANTEQQAGKAVSDYSDTYFDEEADYAMIDSQDIYSFLLAEM